MKIAFDAKRAFLNGSGLGNYSRSTLDLLKKFQPEIEMVLCTPKANSKFSFEALKTSTIISPKSFIWKKLHAFWRSFMLKNALTNSDVQIFHGLSAEIPSGLQQKKIKTVVTIHDLIYVRFPQWYGFFDRHLYNLKYRKAAQKADLVIAISEQTKNDLVDFYKISPEKIRVVYQGCNPIFLQEISDETVREVKQSRNLPDQYILYVGNIEPRKNLMRIFEAIKEGNIQIPVVIVGRNSEYAEKVKQFLQTNRMEHLALWQSYVPNTELPALYKAATVLVYPSIFEGFGIPILEALSCGTPVITSLGSCFAEPGGEHSLYINPLDSSSILKALQQVLSDPNLRKTMSEQGKLHAQKFTEEKIAGNLMEVYKELLR